MSHKISKELFEAVTGNEGTIHEYNKECIINGDVDQYISINDFFFLCKEWALKQGYEIFTSEIKCSVYKINTGWIIDQLEASSEQQACFDACQWILENKDKQ